VGSLPARNSTYWWSEEINNLRKRCIALRRKWIRARRFPDGASYLAIRDDYLLAKRDYRTAIKRAKIKCWKDLIKGIEGDPWGLPYKLVLNRLRRSAPSLTETLSVESLNALLDSLFPVGTTHDPFEEWRDVVISSTDCVVTEGEVYSAIRAGRSSGSPAPGPDGVPIGVWRSISPLIVSHLAKLFSICLEEGNFPVVWKSAKLVLIPKDGSVINEGGLLKARPICLLNEIGKIFERILAVRIQDFMDRNPKARLSEYQYGFRSGSSTLDALNTVVAIIERATGKGGFAIGVSLDVRNAFNSLPWPSIRCALKRVGFPHYLRRIIDGYLCARSIGFPTCDGLDFRSVSCGVPQGSVLGPLLWNLTYNFVLKARHVRGCHVIGYADDTFIVGTGEDVDTARSRVNEIVAKVLRRFDILGLSVAEEKTEAVLFVGKRKPDVDPVIRVGKARIKMAPRMKYLGIILDPKLNFGQHFAYTVEKAAKVNRALCKLMPNLRGPSEHKRRLYANVLSSIVLYGAPIWAESLRNSAAGRRSVLRVQRTIAIRVCSAYRTVSTDAVTLLARLPPWDLLALERKGIFDRMQDSKRLGASSAEDVKSIKLEERSRLVRSWRERLLRSGVRGVWTVDAILPHLEEWMSRGWGGLSFHLTQLLSGHGCFGAYLHRIGKQPVGADCWHCGDDDDTAEHTLSWCFSWVLERVELKRALGMEEEIELPLSRVVEKSGLHLDTVQMYTVQMDTKFSTQNIRHC